LRWANSGKQLGLAIQGHGLDNDAAVRALWSQVAQKHPDLALGFSPSRDAAGVPGIEMTFGGAGTKLQKRVETELFPTIKEMADQLGLDISGTFFKADTRLHSNDWEAHPNGGLYLQRLGERYGPAIQRRLDDYRRGELEPALRQEIDAALKRAGGQAGRASGGKVSRQIKRASGGAAMGFWRALPAERQAAHLADTAARIRDEINQQAEAAA
jgi:hypothetical protein